jgi:tetratricopeptide (TPR) repeat protein
MASGPLAAEGITKRLASVVAVRLDADKDKPKAARYQPNGLPTIVYLSPRGVIVDRTEKVIAEEDLARRLDALAEKGKATDEELEKLEAAVKKDPEDLAALDKLALFWQQHQNWAEACPLLAELVKKAGEKEFPTQTRTQRWIDLVRGLAVVTEFDESVKQADALLKFATSQRNTALAQMAQFLIGFARESQGKKGEAIKAYDRTVELGPDTRFGKKAAELRDKLKGDK